MTMEPKDYVDTKSFKFRPKAPSEQAFFDQHKIEKVENMYTSNSVYDAMFQGNNIRYYKRSEKNHGYDSPEDKAKFR